MSVFPNKLSDKDLLPIAEAAAGESLSDFRLELHQAAHHNHSEDKRFCTLRYRTQEGVQGETVLFVKGCAWKGRSEAVDYRYLSARGVPMPRLYGAVRDGTGADILFLEALTEIGFRDDDEAEWRDMLSLLARFNACDITPEYATHLHRYEQVGTIDGSLWITGLNSLPTHEEIEAELRSAGVAQEELAESIKAAQSLFEQAAAQPPSLLHQDFLWDNFGWRGQREELVVFDVHKNALGPRFADVAPYLALPDWTKWASFLDTIGDEGMTRREALSRHYLDAYFRAGGPAISLQTFQEETTALFWAHKVSCLAWFAEKQSSRTREVVDYLAQMSAGV